MVYRIICFLSLLILITSCSKNKLNLAQKYLNDKNLQEQIFAIDIAKDNNIITQNGIKLNIPAGSIQSDSQQVSLIVKDALGIDDMIKAGLITQTKEGILSSDGMFFISTKEKSTIVKPISIALPSNKVNSNMKLYKGLEENDRIVWQKPTTLAVLKDTAVDGEKLFLNNCAACHSVTKKITGPDLAWVEKRWKSKEALIEFIKSSSDFMHNHHPTDTSKAKYSDAHFERDREYANCLFCRYAQMPQPDFKQLSIKQINAILSYTKEESIKSGIPENHHPNLECEVCANAMHEYVIFMNYYTQKRDSLVKNNGTKTEQLVIEPTDANPNNDNGGLPIKVRPDELYAEYYQFEITAFGWYNVDDLLMDKFNSKESRLVVDVIGADVPKQVFLVIPSIKVFTEGGKLKDSESYGFYVNDGRLYLPQGYEAYVFVLAEKDGKTYFGKQQFYTSVEQKIQINLNEVSKDKILGEIEKLQLKDFTLKIKDTKNQGLIKALDSKADSLLQQLNKCYDCRTSSKILR